MAIVKCPECKMGVSDKAASCPHCGFPVYPVLSSSVKWIKCEYCGVENLINNTICQGCGAILVHCESHNSVISNKIKKKEEYDVFFKDAALLAASKDTISIGMLHNQDVRSG